MGHVGLQENTSDTAKRNDWDNSTRAKRGSTYARSHAFKPTLEVRWLCQEIRLRQNVRKTASEVHCDNRPTRERCGSVLLGRTISAGLQTWASTLHQKNLSYPELLRQTAELRVGLNCTIAARYHGLLGPSDMFKGP